MYEDGAAKGSQPCKVLTVEWSVMVPGYPKPAAVIRRMKLQGVERCRVVAWAPTSSGRELIGCYETGDAAATAGWRQHVDASNQQHELASSTHGGREGNAAAV